MSIWYKLTGQTLYGAYLSVAGSVITVVLNILWIPRSPDHYLSGYMGSAWATFIGYGLMMIFSYFLGQKYYRIPYNLIKIIGYLGFAVVLYYLTVLFRPGPLVIRLVYHTSLLVVYLLVVAWTEKNEFKSFFSS